MDYCHRLAKARDSESDLILDELQSDPGRALKIRTAVRSLGRLNDRFDWFVLTFVCEKDFDSDWSGPLNEELSNRPQLSKRLLWAARTAHVMHSYDENWANWNFQAISKADEQEMLEIWANLRKLAGEGDGGARGFLLGRCVLLHLAWAACGWPDAAKRVTPDNWADRFRHFRRWWEKYEPFLQFDAQLGYFVLHRQAMFSGKPLPDQARRIPKAPLPEWFYSESQEGQREVGQIDDQSARDSNEQDAAMCATQPFRAERKLLLENPLLCRLKVPQCCIQTRRWGFSLFHSVGSDP
jgi:hypothetical protein